MSALSRSTESTKCYKALEATRRNRKAATRLLSATLATKCDQATKCRRSGTWRAPSGGGARDGACAAPVEARRDPERPRWDGGGGLEGPWVFQWGLFLECQRLSGTARSL